MKNSIKFADKYEELIYKYLDYHDPTWTSKTFATESAKSKTILRTIRTAGTRGIDLYQGLKINGYHPHTIKKLVLTASAYVAWGIKNQVKGFGPLNTYADLILTSPQLFRNAYKPERLKVDFDEALERIKSIAQENVKEACLALLKSGLRIHEAFLVNTETSSVIGKGDKLRYVVWTYPPHLKMPTEGQIRYALKKIGLKPHSLRKLLATKLARSNMRHTEIMQLMGWSSFETASKYIQPLNEEQLKRSLEEALK